MRSPYQYVNSEPLPLRSNVIFFHDWRHVNHGYPGWRDPAGQGVNMWATDELPPIHFERGDIPYGVRLRALAPEKSAPFFHAEMPWEGILFSPTVMNKRAASKRCARIPAGKKD